MIFDPSAQSGAGDPRQFILQLIAADWEQPDGPLQLRADLTLAELEGAAHFHNARTILRALVEEDGAAATATGCFNRAFATRLFGEMRMSQMIRESTQRYCKVINEADVRDLTILRTVCEFGALVAKRRKRFRATRRARDLLSDARAGELYRHLCLTFFRKLDLRCVFHFRDVPTIQQTLAVILWRLDAVARDWTPMSKLAGRTLLLPVLEELRATKYPHDTDAWILAGYVINPLHDFGLIERRGKSDWPGIEEKHEIRLSPLWRRFIRFSDEA